ncbi:MAG: hypothetical protein EA360_01400 [Balneolaceae bacterium]|nr:MAG: hypothetical protein EA360_01400 [Balneolaceae bacterium]
MDLNRFAATVASRSVCSIPAGRITGRGEGWRREPFRLPREVKKPFAAAGFSPGKEVLRPGLAHQLKRYCLQKNCTSCKVFKSVIRP